MSEPWRCLRTALVLMFGASLGALLLSGCVHGVAPGGCNNDGDCQEGEICLDATCVAAGEAPAVSCERDADCNVRAGESCVGGVCQAATDTGGGACTVTADCPLHQYCNSATGTCQALLDGWCRQEDQCSASAPICSAQSSAVPGRCVECVTDGDCPNGGTCRQPGICEAPAGNTPGTNPPPGGGTTGGDTGSGDPGTNPSDPGSGDVCADNNWYGDGVCDSFCPEPDPDCAGGGGGGNTGGECVAMQDCWNAGYSIDYTCESGQCVCDVAWMESFVCEPGQTVDVASCTCTGGTTGGGGGQTGGLAENDPCVVDGQVQECGGGLTCIIGGTDASGNPTWGACKQVCSSNAECGGRQCALGFLASGDGICGTPLAEGQAGCNFWDEGDRFCFDPNGPTGADAAILECLNGTCGYICDYEGNAGDPFTCPSSRSCGTSFESYEGFSVDLAICQ